MSVRIVYKDVALGADQDAVMSAIGQASGSALSLLPFGAENEAPYATLEQNMWLLNGKKKLYDGGAFSFWSEELSGADCRFASTPEIVATMDQQYNSLGIFLNFGSINYCAEIEILWYQGATLLAQETYYPTEREFFAERRVQSYNKVVVRFIRTSLPYQRARLDFISFGITRTFKRDELRSVNLIQQISLISKELQENVLDWQLNSASVVDYLFQLKQPVSAYDGEELLGVFYVKSSKRQSARVYDISCTDAVGVLNEEEFPDAYYSGKNALELAREICGDFNVEMEAALQNKTVNGVIVKKTRRAALQQLCFAIGAVADTSGSEGIRIFTPSRTNAKAIPANRVRVGGSVQKSDVVTAVQLTSHNYSTSGSGAYTEIGGVKYYDITTVHTKANPDVTASDKQNVISIADATLVSSANAQEVLQRMFDYYMLRDTHSVSFRLEGERVGDFVATPTNWGDMVTGNLTRASITLSGIAVAAAEVLGS